MRKNMNRLVSGIMIMAMAASSAMMNVDFNRNVYANTVSDVTVSGNIANDKTVDIIAEGKLGDNIVYSYDGISKTFTVKGTGEMWDYVKLPEITTNAESIIIEKGVTSIGTSTFVDFNMLKKVEIPDTVTTIKKEAFHCWIDTLELPASVNCVEERAFLSVDKLVIKGDLKGYAFESVCKEYLGEIVLHGSADDLGKMFVEDYSDEGQSNPLITIADGNKKCTVINGCIASSDKKEIYYYIGTSDKVVIPDTVEKIHAGAFYLKEIKEVTFGKNVKEVGEKAFWGSSLKKVKFNEKLKKIGDYAFEDTKLKSAKFSKKVTLGKGVFDGDVTIRNNAGIKQTSTSICESKVKSKKLNIKYAKVAEATGYEIKVKAGKKTYKYTTTSTSFKKTLDKKIKEYYESVEYEYDYDESVAITVQVRPYKEVKGKKVYGKNSTKKVVEF